VYRGQAAVDLFRRHIVETTQEPNKLMALQEPDELITLSEGTIEFKIDLEKNRIFTHMNRPKPMTYTDPDKERVYTSSLTGPTQHTRIITPEYKIESYPFRWSEGKLKERRATKQVRKNLEYTTSSDPRNCFYTGEPVWDLLSQLSQSLQYKKEKGIKTFDVILEKGKTAKNNVVYRIQVIIAGINHPISTFILKEEMGFNPAYVEDRGNNGLLAFRITTDFVEIDGIFLPSKKRKTQYDESGRHSRDSDWTINNTQVNAELPDKTFSVDNCGLSDGDSFVDEINNKNYIYKGDGKLVEVEKKSE